MADSYRREPIINVPGVVVIVLLVVLAVHMLRSFGDPLLSQELLTYLSLYPYRLGPNASEVVGGFGIGITSLATHALLHGDWMHLLINSAWLLAFGSLVARRAGPIGFLLLFIVCAVAGGLTYVAVNGFSKTIVVGMSGAVSGLMGCAFRLIFTTLQYGGMAVLQHDPLEVPRLPLWAILQHRQTMMATGIWIVMNLLLALAGPALLDGSGIAWEAHLGGFIVGFVLFGAVDRGRRLH